MASLTVSPAEGAEMVGCSDDHIRQLVREGVLPRVPHTGRRILIPRVALLEVFGLTDVERQLVTAGAVSVVDGESFS